MLLVNAIVKRKLFCIFPLMWIEITNGESRVVISVTNGRFFIVIYNTVSGTCMLVLYIANTKMKAFSLLLILCVGSSVGKGCVRAGHLVSTL